MDGLVIAGGRSSGCVRAIAMEAHHRGHTAIVVPEAVYDRYEAAHAMALFDCHTYFSELCAVDTAVEMFRTA